MKSGPGNTEPELAITHGIGAKVRTGGRIWRMTAASAAGWLAAFVVTVPIKIADLVRDAVGDRRLLVDSLTHGLIVWVLITFGLAAVLVLLLLGPLATVVPSGWVVRHPRIAAAGLPVLFSLPLGYRMVTWAAAKPGPYEFPGPIYVDYTVFILAFLVVSSMIYLRLVRRGMRPCSLTV